MKKILIILISLICGIATIFILQPIFHSHFSSREDTPSTKPAIPPRKTVWLNIFVHGSFGSLIGLISLNNVLKDEVQGTTYRDLNRDMRDDKFFFQSQAILERGLHKITPTFTLPTNDKPRYAAYPITKAFDEFLRVTMPGDTEQYYYTFGWSGLMSQQRRRFEAIRLFNALQEEISSLRAQNIETKIRLLAHSHGGNLCLNLGAITPILHTKTFSDGHKYSLDKDMDDSIKKMLAIMKTLPTKESALNAKNQKRFDYVPTEKDLSIEELILLGTPIQPETENFLVSPIFKTIYNMYSAADMVQQMDWVSTKDPTSKQRANAQLLLKANKFAYQKDIPRILQVNIMYERPVTTSQDNGQLNIVKKLPNEKASMVDSLLGTRPASKDPDHRSLWFLGSEKQQHNDNESFIFPLPTVAIIPPILALLDKNPAQLDVDINVTFKDKFVEFFLTKHQSETVLANFRIHKTILDDIKAQTLRWLPENVSPQKEFSVIYQHLFKPNQAANNKL